MRVLLSIKPEFVKLIFEGAKSYEFRRSIFKLPNISEVVVYATKPVGRIVGEFQIAQVIETSPRELWRITSQTSGLSKKRFDEYFEGKDTGYALQISNPRLYDNPIDPKSIDEKFVAPQSFRYIKEPVDFLK